MSDSKHDQSKSATKNARGATLRLLSSMIATDNETDFPHELLFSGKQVAILCKFFSNYLTGSMNLSKIQISGLLQSSGFLGKSVYHWW